MTKIICEIKDCIHNYSNHCGRRMVNVRHVSGISGTPCYRTCVSFEKITSQPSVQEGRAKTEACSECETWFALGQNCQLCNRKPPAP